MTSLDELLARYAQAADEINTVIGLLERDFNGWGSGPSGLRAEALAHSRIARLVLTTDKPRQP